MTRTSAEKIHSDGRVLYSPPLKVFHLPNPGGEEDRLIISVPKRLFKRAVKRNLLRRRIREAWRAALLTLPDGSSDAVSGSGARAAAAGRVIPDGVSRSTSRGVLGQHCMVVYTSTEIMDYGRISESVGSVIARIG